MPNSLPTLIIAVCLAAYTLTAHAQTIQPGLWEASNIVVGGSGESGEKIKQMQQQMANATPEQRKAMEQMASPEGQKAMQARMQAQMANATPEQRKAMEQSMAQLSNMRFGSDGRVTLKTCITPEIIERKSWMGRYEGKCTHTASPAVGNTQKFGFTCTDPASTGEGSVTFLSPTSYTSSMKVSSVRNGKPESMVFEGTGKFLGADCGSVKPLVTK